MTNDFDPRAREICPDGACIGVIGPEGRCKECGKVAPSAVSDPRHRGLDLEAAGALDSSEGSDQLPENDAELAARELCPDGACIGVLGLDGRCPECGKAASEIEEEGQEDGEEDRDGDSALEAPPEFDARALCPDGACIGVLDGDGRCPECGATPDGAGEFRTP